jgi:predicted amidohydrolase YtcJ
MNFKNITMSFVLGLQLLLAACSDSTPPAAETAVESTVIAKAAADTADTIFINGKILTVDSEFSTANALAVKGDRIMAVGTNDEVNSHVGADTQVIDLAGKTMIPGLIDNHIHFIRAGQSWDVQARIDGIKSRQEALDIISAKAASMEPGEWLMVQGGWWTDQFSDKPGDFTLEELDAAAPNNPLFLQLVYFTVYANTLALEAVGADPADGARHNTGELINAQPPYGKLNEQIPAASKAQIKQNVRDVIARFNRAGLTSVYDVGRPPEGDITLLDEMVQEETLNLRVWHTLKYEAYNDEDADKAIELIKNTKPNTTDDYVGLIGVGEHAYLPFFDRPGFDEVYSDEIVSTFGKISRAAAEQGFRMNEHTMMKPTIDSALDEWEKIGKDIPLTPLRWSLEHLFNPTDEQLIRMKELGVTATVHGVAQTLPASMQPPMKRMQELGVVWGLGSDGTIVTPFQPFLTLGWAVTGKVFSGKKLFEETVTREEALIAHTRTNAYLLFKEKDLGSLEVGKLADLVVLDKDYMTVPEEEIYYIESDLTMVGGRIVYDAAQ